MPKAPFKNLFIIYCGEAKKVETPQPFSRKKSLDIFNLFEMYELLFRGSDDLLLQIIITLFYVSSTLFAPRINLVRGN